MKYVSFVANGLPSFGLVGDGGIVDLQARTKQPTLRAWLAAGGLADVRDHASAAIDFRWDDVRLLPVIPDPEHIACVGTNYRSHIAEVAEAGVQRTVPTKPSIFLRAAQTLAAHGQPLLLPHVSTCLDYEGELAVIIGTPGRYIAERDALSHVAGYACFNDASVRDWQFHTNNITPGKNFPQTGALGPWMTSAGEIPDPHHLAIVTRLNGQTVQEGNTTDMIFTVPAIIAYVSSFLALRPGDIIATGTPAGVGFSRNPPIFLAPGDVCEVAIDTMGTLVNPIETEAYGSGVSH